MPIIQDVQDGPSAAGQSITGAHRQRHATGTAALLLTVALGIGIASCSGSAQIPIASDVPTADRGDLRAGGTVRWAVDSVPATFNVFRSGSGPDAALVAEAVLPMLFRLDENARAAPDPDYLVSAESTAPSADRSKQTVVYRLNPKAAWSNGKPLSAADFAAQWKALSGTDPTYEGMRPAGYSAIESVTRGADAHEVKVVFKEPYAQWRGLFSPLYPAAATGTATVFNSGSRDKLAATAGPFRMGKVDRKAGRITLVRNPAWWGDKAKLDRIDLLAVPAARRLDYLDQGKLDVATIERSVDTATAVPARAADAAPAAGSEDAAKAALMRAEALPGLHLYRAAAPVYTQLTLNAGRGPLANAKVRRAVASAVDRQRIADAVLGPFRLPAAVLGNHLVMGDQDGYQDNSAALGRTGQEEAAKLLEAAGWKLGSPATPPPTAAGLPSRSARPSASAAASASARASSAAASASARASSAAASASARASSAAASASARASSAAASPSARASSAAASASARTSSAAVPAAVRASSAAAAPSPRASSAALPAAVRAKSGKQLSLDLLIPTGSSSARRIASAIGSDLAKVGIVAVPRAVDGKSFTGHLDSGDFDLAVFSWPATANTVADESALYAKPQPGPDGLPVIGLNFSRTGTDEIDELLDEATSAMDPEDVARLTQEADARIWELVPSLPLFQRPEVVAVRNGIAGIGAFGFTTPRFQDMGYTRKA